MEILSPPRRKLPKITACMSRASKETMQTVLLYNIPQYDSKQIRRAKKPLHKCIILELKEAGFVEASNYLENILYDNEQLVKEDDIGMLVDIRKRKDYLEDISAKLQKAETYRGGEKTQKESQVFLNLGLKYAELGRGLLWLAEKFFLAAIAVASQYLTDGGRWQGICKYHYAKFLLDKFPDADTEEAFQILCKVRETALGKTWLLEEAEEGQEPSSKETVQRVVSVELWRVLLSKARKIRKTDPSKAERLSRLAEKRARDAGDLSKYAEASVEVGAAALMMNNLKSALKFFESAVTTYESQNNTAGQCDAIVYLAVTLQRQKQYEKAYEILNKMGVLAMEHGLRKHLGKALHFLGEMHLRMERPDLGTGHLCEAFSCFMGISFNLPNQPASMVNTTDDSILGFKSFEDLEGDTEIYYEEAEQSRLMAAVSAGQELMTSYFCLLRAAATCTVAQVKVVEWKFHPKGWWFHHKKDDLIPCVCPIHNRTPLDVISNLLKMREMGDSVVLSEPSVTLGRTTDTTDLRGRSDNTSDVTDGKNRKELPSKVLFTAQSDGAMA